MQAAHVKLYKPGNFLAFIALLKERELRCPGEDNQLSLGLIALSLHDLDHAINSGAVSLG